MKLLLRLLAFLLLAFAASLDAQTTTDPRLTSWFVSPSGRYARLYETDAAKTSGTASTTWSRGSGTVSTPVYAGVVQVSYSTSWVYLRTSGLGYHVMGPWYINAAHTQNFPNFPGNTATLYRIPRTPTVPATKTLTGLGSIGYFVDGVSLFDNRDAYSYSTTNNTDAQPTNGLTGNGVWNRDAYNNEAVTFDPAYAHQAGATYHYHANTPALRYELGDHVDYNSTTKTYSESTTTATKHSPILGWVADGYPIYGPYGYASPMDASSGVRRMISGYVKRDGTNGTTDLASTGRTTIPAWAARAQNRSAALTTTVYGPSVNTTYSLGHYIEDFDYLGDLGKTQGTDFDLDQYNGRFCVTPEFPNGTYAYFMSIESDGTPRFPYNIGRWYYGNPTGSSVTSIAESVTEYVRGGQAAAINVTAALSGGTVLISWSSVEGGTYSLATSTDGVTFTTLATGLTSTGLTTTYSTTTAVSFYRVTLTALAAYDTAGTAGLSGLNNNGTATYTVPVGTTGTARLVNIATRALIGGSAGTPISGFVLVGSGTRKMLVRAVGPSLVSYGVSAALSDPSLRLVGDTTSQSNDNWLAADATTFAATGAFALPSGSKDAALVATLTPGAYSAPVGDGGGTGIALLEVYDAESSSNGAKLVNASTRAYVGTGDNILIPGFVIGGEGTVQLLVRAIGPTLKNYGVTDALADPQMTLYQSSTAIATNDNWSSASNAADIATAAAQSGAFALPAGSKDAAFLVTLGAGAYSIALSGVGGTTGTALVEIYVLK